jgi:phosphoglucomutase
MKSLGKQPESLFAKVGSFYPPGENFRLTPEVKAKFTEKLRTDPGEFSGSKVAQVVPTDGLKLVLAHGSWGLLPALGHEACGASPRRGA